MTSILVDDADLYILAAMFLPKNTLALNRTLLIDKIN